jgi:hypothetical protein
MAYDWKRRKKVALKVYSSFSAKETVQATRARWEREIQILDKVMKSSCPEKRYIVQFRGQLEFRGVFILVLGQLWKDLGIVSRLFKNYNITHQPHKLDDKNHGTTPTAKNDINSNNPNTPSNLNTNPTYTMLSSSSANNSSPHVATRTDATHSRSSSPAPQAAADNEKDLMVRQWSPTVRRLTREMLFALSCLRDCNIVHLDIRLDNILLDRRENRIIRLVDFNSAYKLVDKKEFFLQKPYSREFSANYAPEFLMGHPICQAADMWALGCVVSELCTGVPLFSFDSAMDHLRKIVELLGSPPKDSQIYQHLTNQCKAEEKSERKTNVHKHLDFAACKDILWPPGPSGRRLLAARDASLEAALGECASPEALDFLRRCLCWEPASRIKPVEAQSCEWFYEDTCNKTDSNKN